MRTAGKDWIAGGLMLAIGLGAAGLGATYQLGTPSRMGPGFMPVALGVLLALVGTAIALSPPEPEEVNKRRPADWVGWSAVAGGPFLFIVLAHYAGLIPASFACVFVSALGDRTATWRGALLLAAGVTAFGAVLFGLVLRIPLPLLRLG